MRIGVLVILLMGLHRAPGLPVAGGSWFLLTPVVFGYSIAVSNITEDDMQNIVDRAEQLAMTEIARENLAKYDARDGMTGNPDWDLIQAAKLAETVRNLLDVIEKQA